MVADAIVSPLGSTTQENYEKIRKGISGLKLINDVALRAGAFYGGHIQHFPKDNGDTKFEAFCKNVLQQLIEQFPIEPERTIFILSTTKGNITYLEEGNPHHPRIHLHATATYLSQSFGLTNQVVVSNACISGVMALLMGKRMIENGKYDHAIIVGADVLSNFVLSGFQSLQALSPDMCRPFDAQRKGINLGECAAGVVLSCKQGTKKEASIRVTGGGLSNDANHISGPSRTGEELGFAIRQAMEEAEIDATMIDFISAHGTATIYNDEMEAKAFNMMHLNHVPLNSLKGYYGHTLGAAGVLETIISAESLKRDELIPTAGFEQMGVTQSVNVIKQLEHRRLSTCLKTASGFGGCNAAIILQKGQ